MAKIVFEKDGIEFSDEGPMSEIMKILIEYLEENNLRVEHSPNGNRMIHRDSHEFFGKVCVEM